MYLSDCWSELSRLKLDEQILKPTSPQNAVNPPKEPLLFGVVFEAANHWQNWTMLCLQAQSLGYHPEFILSGRRLNDGMGAYVLAQLVKALTRKRRQVYGAKIPLLGSDIQGKLSCHPHRAGRGSSE